MSYAMLCGDHHPRVPPRALLLLPHSWQVALDVLACNGMVSGAAAPLELMVAWLQEWSVTCPGPSPSPRLVDGPAARSVKFLSAPRSHGKLRSCSQGPE